MTGILKAFDSICRKYDIKYWCTGGTLIGADRHKGWVPWDSDIDISMLIEDYTLFRSKIGELPDSMWFQDRETDPLHKSIVAKIRDKNSCFLSYKDAPFHSGLALDIFLYSVERDKIVTYLGYKSSSPAITGDDFRDFDNDIIFPLKEGLFENISVYVPNNIEKFLFDVWGIYPLPLLPIDKRFPHKGLIDPDNASAKTKELYPYFYDILKIHRSSKIQPGYSVIDHGALTLEGRKPSITIGKYCSIDPKCTFLLYNHLTNRVSSSSVFLNTHKFARNLFHRDSGHPSFYSKGDILIKNDVYIGANVHILDGLTIGNGAVIGCCSVVTKSVPAYAIVAGNPAVVINYRFSEEIIKQLEELDFWSLSDKEIDEFDIFSEDIDAFIESVKKYKVTQNKT